MHLGIFKKLKVHNCVSIIVWVRYAINSNMENRTKSWGSSNFNYLIGAITFYQLLKQKLLPLTSKYPSSRHKWSPSRRNILHQTLYVNARRKIVRGCWYGFSLQLWVYWQGIWWRGTSFSHNSPYSYLNLSLQFCISYSRKQSLKQLTISEFEKSIWPSINFLWTVLAACNIEICFHKISTHSIYFQKIIYGLVTFLFSTHDYPITSSRSSNRSKKDIKAQKHNNGRDHLCNEYISFN